jgi:hypothetical protein
MHTHPHWCCIDVYSLNVYICQIFPLILCLYFVCDVTVPIAHLLCRHRQDISRTVFRAIPLLCGTSGLFWRGKIGIMKCTPSNNWSRISIGRFNFQDLISPLNIDFMSCSSSCAIAILRLSFDWKVIARYTNLSTIDHSPVWWNTAGLWSLRFEKY